MSGEQPVALFFDQIGANCDHLTMVGRLDPGPGRYPYEMDNATLVALPPYRSGAAIGALMRRLPESLRRFWRMLDTVDVAWVFGPTLMAPLFALLTLLRRRRLVLGVRQDLPALCEHRYPERPLVRAGARLLEASFRSLARVAPVAVVGPQLARNYRRARATHTMYVSLLRAGDVGQGAAERDYAGDTLRMLSVGRLDPEKNPTLLADILAGALRDDTRWRLDVCGDGPLAAALSERLAQLGIGDRATLHGHVPVDGGLLDLYRHSHAFIHVSFSEGAPQVLLEAFATGLPVVATAVGGVPEMVGDAGLLVAPGDAGGAVDALGRIVGESDTRRGLVNRGLERARQHTREAEASRAAAFALGEPPPG